MYTELPTGTWSEWYGPQAGPPYYGGICPCKTVLQVRTKWPNPGMAGGWVPALLPGLRLAPPLPTHLLLALPQKWIVWGNFAAGAEGVQGVSAECVGPDNVPFEVRRQ